MTNDPQDNYPDELDVYRKKMQEKGWELGEDDEELFEYAMHPTQYEAYKSGKAKADFEADLEKRRAAKENAGAPAKPKSVVVTVNGVSYQVGISYDGKPAATASSAAPTQAAPAPAAARNCWLRWRASSTS